jgi:hypothetical protein
VLPPQGSKGPTGIYQKWAKKNRLRVGGGAAGEQHSAQLAAAMGDRRVPLLAPRQPTAV